MAGDEPSEDADAGADAGEAASDDPGDASGEPAPEEPGAPREDAPPAEAEDGDRDAEDGEPDDESGTAGADATETTGETETEDVGDVAGDEAVEAEAEALVEEMEVAVAEAESAEGPDSTEGEAAPPADDEPRIFPAGGVPREGRDTEGEAPDDEGVPMAPDVASDAEIDVPADDGEPLDHAGPVAGDEPVVEDGSVVGDAAEADDLDEPGGLLGGSREGPADDREMPLADHIREMLRRLAVVIAVAGFVSLLVFPFAEDLINFLWYSILPGVESDIARPRLYGVLELVFTELKVASLAGLIVALPVMVYETYAFMRPGLYPHERRYYLAAIPTSLVLALVGVSFAYFVVLPAIFVYFTEYTQGVARIGFALGQTFDLILLLMGYMAIVFQIPLFIMLAMMMGLVTRRWLAQRRLLFWGAFLGISFLFSPDPTGMAPILVAATMIALFEGTLLLTKWTGRE